MHETKQYTSEGTLTLADACDSKTNYTYQLENRTNTILKQKTNKNTTQQTNKQYAIKGQESVFWSFQQQ